MKFVVATHNTHKLEEFERILTPLGVQIALRELSDVEETGETFAENAFLTAESAMKETGLPAIADDSGLMVDALNGAPGVYSARYAGEGGTYDDVIRKLLFEMRDVPEENRTARFVSSICCVFPDGETLRAEGVCEGMIAFEKRGEGGFGYDPVFLVGDRSFAEMTGAEKDAVSHRGRALRAFSKILEERIGKED